MPLGQAGATSGQAQKEPALSTHGGKGGEEAGSGGAPAPGRLHLYAAPRGASLRGRIEEHKRLHDDGILRQRLLKATDNRRKLVGVNYENDDLVAAQNGRARRLQWGDYAAAENEAERATAFRQVFKARDENRKKGRRDWKYLDELGGGSSIASDGGGGMRGSKSADYNNKYHQMAVREARLKKQGKTLADAEQLRNQQRKTKLSENVRETFLPSGHAPLDGRKGE